ncbi:tRNA threonylcarbamoyladenosine dehydratase [Clostridium aminobutyricum]|uniref:tRNA threonylcarbamoyladenosine dehydratase n=1 Tax=Clostridium aminobutyricum TaxID=33953 RepID=A0A939IIU7_CLOAM|nr:tRNA threonylcarbamoyladenosine dehydratase [Clostridium aminobutyricum]MBN7773441.1 tRNA threonylcarbamoyladenosine dehydratase [Clostridium aminobutyricum]
MLHAFSRSELLLGRDSIEKLKNCRVAVFGIGGVGTFAVEGLARTGVGKFLLVDDDAICLTNINRQLHATRKTVGQSKVDVMKERILDINPEAEVTVMKRFLMAEEKRSASKNPIAEADALYWDELLAWHHAEGNHIDYIIDAIDTVSAKLDLIVNAQKAEIPIISCMGMGNKLDPTRIEVSDIYKTSICPLAKVIRKELRNRHVKALKVVYSKEEPLIPIADESNSCSSNCICPKGTTRTCTVRRAIPGSVSFVPSVGGLIIAGEVIKDLIDYKG